MLLPLPLLPVSGAVRLESFHRAFQVGRGDFRADEGRRAGVIFLRVRTRMRFQVKKHQCVHGPFLVKNSKVDLIAVVVTGVLRLECLLLVRQTVLTRVEYISAEKQATSSRVPTGPW